MKGKGKTAAACLAFAILFVCYGKILEYILVDDTASYTRIMFHEMYEQDQIDVLFAVYSHCYRSFVPEVFDSAWGGVNSFNAGTSSQGLDGSYMIIREAAKYNDIKHIYLELYFRMAFESYKERTEMTQTYIISDYLKPSLEKIRYLLEASDSSHYFNSFILARRNWQKFFEPDYVKNVLVKKQTDDYKNYAYTYVTGDVEWYAGKGYVANKDVVKNGNFFSSFGWEQLQMDQTAADWENSLKDIIQYCDEKGIQLTLVSAPMSNFMLAGIENYDDYVEYVKRMLAGTGVEYYDFNLCRESFFPGNSELFKDPDHLNCYGAEAFSRLLADFVSKDISKDQLFYSSFQEKMECLEPTVFGISFHEDCNEKGETVRSCKIVSNGRLEYQIEMEPNEGDSYTQQEFSDNRFFSVSPDDHGICTVTYRLKEDLSNVRSVSIAY